MIHQTAKLSWIPAQQRRRPMRRVLCILLVLSGTLVTSRATLKAQEASTTNDKPASSDVDSNADDQTTSNVELPWEVRPYRVLVSLASDGSSAFTDDFQQQIEETLRGRIGGILGRYWNAELEWNDWLFPAREVSLQRLTSDNLNSRYASTDFDKVLLVTIEDKGGLRLSGCEWDRSSGERGPVLERKLIDRRRVADVTFELLLDMFQPLVRIDASENGTAELRARAGELLVPESLSVMFKPGDLLVPYFRYLTREKEVRSIQSVPWTYLRIDQINRSRLVGIVESAFNAPLAGSRRRVELMAIRVEPRHPKTRLRLAPRNNPALPLVGVRVRVYEHLPTEERPSPEMTELMTDRFGQVEIPASPGAPLRRLLVHSGGAVLSNVPFVPGLERDLSIELPDDSPRLQAEGNLAIVQGELIDQVSRRTIMLARVLSRARKDEWNEVDQLLAKIDQLPSIGSFKSKILAIRVPAVAEAQQNNDRVAEQRIVDMCRQLEELVDRYLDRTVVRDVLTEVGELRKASRKASASG